MGRVVCYVQEKDVQVASLVWTGNGVQQVGGTVFFAGAWEGEVLRDTCSGIDTVEAIL